MGPCLAGTSNNMQLHVARAEVVMEILVVADTGMSMVGRWHIM